MDDDIVEKARVVDLEDVHEGAVYALDWASNNEFIVSGSMDKSCSILYTRVDEEGISIVDKVRLEGHEGTVRTVCSTPEDKPRIISAGQDALVKVWDASSGKLSARIRGNHSHVQMFDVGLLC